MPNAPGYFWLKNSDKLKNFEKDPQFEDLTVIRDGSKYVTGTLLKMIQKDVQPSNKQKYRRFVIGNNINEISITQTESGPSSEIIFQSELVTNEQKFKNILLFLHKAAEKINKYTQKYEDTSAWFTENLEIAREIIYALKNQIKNKNQFDEDIKDMFLQLVPLVEGYVTRYKEFTEDTKNITKFIESLRKMTQIDVDKYPEKSYTATLEIEKFLKSSLKAYNDFHQNNLTDITEQTFIEKFKVLQTLVIGNLHIAEKTVFDSYLDSTKENILSFQNGFNNKIEQIKFNQQNSLGSQRHFISFDQEFGKAG